MKKKNIINFISALRFTYTASQRNIKSEHFDYEKNDFHFIFVQFL